MIKSILSPDDGTAISIGEATNETGGVIVNDAFYALPHFTLYNGAPPDHTPYKWRLVAGEWQRINTAEFSSMKAKLAAQIDVTVAEIYARWTRFQAEYVDREAAARQFIADGTPSDWVTDFSGPAGLSDTDAAALIIQQADGLRVALRQLGGQRMRKYQVMAANTEETAQDIANDILGQVRSIAAALT